LRREINSGLQVVENRNSANEKIYYGRDRRPHRRARALSSSAMNVPRARRAADLADLADRLLSAVAALAAEMERELIRTTRRTGRPCKRALRS
jgi:hypothetical protein